MCVCVCVCVYIYIYDISSLRVNYGLKLTINGNIHLISLVF